jgi:hypothetical protein
MRSPYRAEAIWILFLSIIFPSTCFAYVDPSTGGYIFQLLFPIISAITAVCIFFRNSIKRLFGIVFRNNRDVSNPDE